MRRKIIAMSVAVTLLAMLCAQSAAAQAMAVHAWTEKLQYEPGEKARLKISLLNELEVPVEIHNITILYPWFHFDAEKGEWVGNETVKGEPLATMTSKGTENDHYYREVEFTIPKDGRAIMGSTIDIFIETTEGMISGEADLLVAGPGFPMSIEAFDTWMTSLIAAVVVCTIILAIVILFATRGARAPRALMPMAPTPSPPKPKAKIQ